MGKSGDSDGDTLEDPTSNFEYDLFEYSTTGKPNWAKTRMRETHQDEETRWLEQYTYFSGSGGVVMVKAQARPGLAPERDEFGELVLDEGEVVLVDTSPVLRWIGNGRVIKDNKGNVVKAYEPYYSSIPDYEDEAELVEQGVSPLMHYDPLGRLIRTDFPNGTFSKVEFTAWEQTTHDQNDMVAESDWYAERYSYGGADEALLKEKRAALEAYEHRETPTVVHLDTLGRPFLTIAHNKDGEDDVFTETKSVMDIQGHVLGVIDARGNTAEQRTYGMLGQSLEVISHDAGDRVHLLDALGQPMRSWDDRNQRFSATYDTLRRPVDRSVSVSGGSEKLLSRIVYGELLASPADTNHRGRVYRVYDGAGVATTLAFDFKGHAFEEERQLYDDKTTQPDWSALFGEDTIADMATAAASLLDAETFSASSERDALGRVLTAISPDGSEVHYGYDEGGALQQVTLHHRGGETEQTVVGDITYDAKGRREEVVYGPTGDPTSTTTYTYDELSQRLIRLRTVRESDSETIQSLHYHYDPVGNITDIRDTAQQTVYFDNTVVSAANSYTYDALYRLVKATGREHSSEGTAQRTHTDLTATAQPMTSDPSAMRLYTQQYVYDEVGNILEMKHIPSSGTGWTRYYEYDEDGNRLLATSAPGDDPEGPYTHEYAYDDHGNMVAMPHLSSMIWNHDDELREVTAGSETVYFQYAGGSRSRKFTEKSGTTTEERIYLGNFEIYRKRISGDIDVERESLHISDGTGRILLIETKTIHEGDPVTTPTGIWRYQLSNHLGSASTEITEGGDIISYEEYHPYGTTAYRAVDSSIDVSAKRYRYTGMERDEETGLSYHTARYYASWLGRWTAADPIGIADEMNRWSYVSGSPITQSDGRGTAPPTAEELATQREIVTRGREENLRQAKEDLNEVKREHAQADYQVKAAIETGDPKAIDRAYEVREQARMNVQAFEGRLHYTRTTGDYRMAGVTHHQLEERKLLAMEGMREIAEKEAVEARVYDTAADEKQRLVQLGHDLMQNAAEELGITQGREVYGASVAFFDDPDLGSAAHVVEKAAPLLPDILAGGVIGRYGRKIALKSGVKFEGWAARNINDPECRIGCEGVAAEIKRFIGGDIVRITPGDNAPSLGAYRGKNLGWAHHEVVVKDGRVYDAFTGDQGVTVEEYKKLWQYPESIDFGF